MIAFDATAKGTANASSLTFSHTCTGSNRLLVVGVSVNGATSDDVTGVTYNGVAMTKNKTVNIGTGEFAYLFSLIAPATGANNVVISLSEAPFVRAVSASYTGAVQSGQPDATGSNATASGTTITAAVTVVAANCWIVSVLSNDGALAETPAGVLTTSRGNQDQVCYLGDSNGVVSTGSQNATWTSGSQALLTCAMSIVGIASNTGGAFLLNFI